MYSLLKDHYHAQAELLVRKKMKLKKNNVYIVRLKQDTQKILADLDIMDGVVFNGNVSNEIMGNAQMIPSGAISKSGINHRIRKINEFAEKLREKSA